MYWDESKHPRDKQGKFTTADYAAMSIDELKDESTVQLSENAKYVAVTPITDDAINNVPVVDIPGYTKEECEYIAEQHKELLRYARDKNLHNEVAFVYREGFKDRLVLKGESDTIDFNYVMQGKGNGIVILHNHPRNHTFSMADLFVFGDNDGIRTMTIVKNNGDVEIVTKPQDFDSSLFTKTLYRSLKKNNKMGTIHEIEKAVYDTLSKKAGGIIWRKQES